MSASITDKDLGFKKLIEDLDAKTVSKQLTVGIMAESPRAQFRLGTAQEFRPETAGLLLRKPIDAKRDDYIRRLKRIGRMSFFGEVEIDQALRELGNDIKLDMGRQTDPPPQLRNAIIVKVEDAT